jgi:selenium-binding protein 1
MHSARLVALVLTAICAIATPSRADETCQSPYLPKIVGQEDYVYVWTLGIDGLGDGSDKLVTIGANPARTAEYGKVVSSVSVGGRGEAHHGGFTDDRRRLWLGGLDDSKIHVFDVATDPAKPKVVKTISDFVAKSGGVVGPHTFYALPGRMLISALSNETGSGKTALVEYNNQGDWIATHWLPEGAAYGYDVRVNADLNRMLTSSFTGKDNYMRPLGELMGDAEAMKRFGDTMVVWNFHTRKPLQTLAVPGAPLEIRWALQPDHHYAFTAAALTSKLWSVLRKPDGTFEAVEIGAVGDPAKLPLPVDISLSADDRHLFVSSFNDGTVRVFDVSNPRAAKLVYEKQIGRQLNMVSQSWDGKRLYFTSSLLANWDKGGDDDEQFLRSFAWSGADLAPRFAIDFKAEKLGRPHIMNFGAIAFYQGRVAAGESKP